MSKDGDCGSRITPDLRGALRLTLIYLTVGTAWIVLSDRILGWIVSDPARYAQFQTIKGWFYVVATSALFGMFAYAELKSISALKADELRARRVFEETVEASLLEKEALLRELNHRVKNNLQLISSLVSLRMDRITDPVSRAFFREFLSRLKAMALVYDSLFATNAFSVIDLGSLIREAVAEYSAAFGTFGIRFSCCVEEGLEVDMEKAVPIALIINEAVLNAIGHAFPEKRGGSVNLVAGFEGETIKVEIRDDGIGFDPARIGNDTVGLTIVRSLAQQIEASVEIPSSESGTTIALRLAPAQARPKTPPERS